MPQATVKGSVLEIIERQDKEGKKFKEARLFQPGEKELIAVKGVNGDVTVGDFVELDVRIYPYYLGGKVGLACSLVKD